MKRSEELSVVVLKRDLPAYGLHAGNVGTVVLVYEPDAVEVEFFDRLGETHALLTLLDADLSPARDSDLASAAAPEPWPEGTQVPIADATVRAST